MNLTITPAAETFIRRMLRLGGGPGSGFRLAVTPGGCSGLAAEFDVESGPREGEAVVRAGGLTLFLPAESRLLLEGVTIDFAEDATSTGFVFRDPKASACGCADTPEPAALVQLEAHP